MYYKKFEKKSLHQEPAPDLPMIYLVCATYTVHRYIHMITNSQTMTYKSLWKCLLKQKIFLKITPFFPNGKKLKVT